MQTPSVDLFCQNTVGVQAEEDVKTNCYFLITKILQDLRKNMYENITRNKPVVLYIEIFKVTLCSKF